MQSKRLTKYKKDFSAVFVNNKEETIEFIDFDTIGYYDWAKSKQNCIGVWKTKDKNLK